ncbi:MAG TPA: ABC-2 family transporter protein [Egibacteraceae bacterium]|nr:ABC-2 family transporter protein [Egibacteraceae bacterium]
MRKYMALARVARRTMLAYRGGFIVHVLGATLALVALFYLWRAIFAASTALEGYTWEQMKAYLLVAFLSSMLVAWFGEWRVAEKIMDGEVAGDLVKPLDFQRARLAEVVGAVAIELVVSAVAVAVILVAFGSMVMPGGLHAALFAVSFVAGLMLKFTVVYAVALVCFWTTGYLGVVWARTAITNLLSGALIPLAFFPGWLRGLAQALPFQGIVATPAAIYLEQVDARTAVRLIAVQAAWIVALWWVGRFMFSRGVRQVTIHGG